MEPRVCAFMYSTHMLAGCVDGSGTFLDTFSVSLCSDKGTQTPGSPWPWWGTSVGLSSAPVCGVPADNTWSHGHALVLSDRGTGVATGYRGLGTARVRWVCFQVVLSCFVFALGFGSFPAKYSSEGPGKAS